MSTDPCFVFQYPDLVYGVEVLQAFANSRRYVLNFLVCFSFCFLSLTSLSCPN